MQPRWFAPDGIHYTSAGYTAPSRPRGRRRGRQLSRLSTAIKGGRAGGAGPSSNCAMLGP